MPFDGYIHVFAGMTIVCIVIFQGIEECSRLLIRPYHKEMNAMPKCIFIQITEFLAGIHVEIPTYLGHQADILGIVKLLNETIYFLADKFFWIARAFLDHSALRISI